MQKVHLVSTSSRCIRGRTTRVLKRGQAYHSSFSHISSTLIRPSSFPTPWSFPLRMHMKTMELHALTRNTIYWFLKGQVRSSSSTTLYIRPAYDVDAHSLSLCPMQSPFDSFLDLTIHLALHTTMNISQSRILVSFSPIYLFPNQLAFLPSIRTQSSFSNTTIRNTTFTTPCLSNYTP